MEKPTAMYFDHANLLDTVLMDIFQRVGGLELRLGEAAPFVSDSLVSLSIMTQGDYKLTFLLRTEEATLRRITKHMKHGSEPTTSDIPVYATEFLNILCGHFISKINRGFHLSARFSIPRYQTGAEGAPEGLEPHDQRFYYYDGGIVEIITFLHPNSRCIRRTN